MRSAVSNDASPNDIILYRGNRRLTIAQMAKGSKADRQNLQLNYDGLIAIAIFPGGHLHHKKPQPTVRKPHQSYQHHHPNSQLTSTLEQKNHCYKTPKAPPPKT